jgi:hypothetical protein
MKKYFESFTDVWVDHDIVDLCDLRAVLKNRHFISFVFADWVFSQIYGKQIRTIFQELFHHLNIINFVRLDIENIQVRKRNTDRFDCIMFGNQNIERVPSCKGEGSKLIIADYQNSEVLGAMQEKFKLIAGDILYQGRVTKVWRRGSCKELKSTD